MSFKEIDRKAILDDEHIQRLKRIKLIERETAEQAPLWQAKQATLFPTAIPLTQTPTLGQVITEETQKNAYDPDVLYQRAEAKIKEIADNTNTQYILDRLEDDDLFFLVNSWDGIIKKLKDEYSKTGLDKNVFVTLIKSMQKTFNNTINSDINLTERGELRKKQKEDSDREQQAKSDEEKSMLRNQKGMFDEEVNQKQQAKEASDLREEEEHERLVQEQIRKQKEKRTKDLLIKLREDRAKAKKTEAIDSSEPTGEENDFTQYLRNIEQDSTPFMHSDFDMNRKFRDVYDKTVDNVMLPKIKGMTKSSKQTAVKLLYEKFPNKMDSIDGKLSDEQKIIEFATLDLYDKLVVEQIKELKKQGTVPEDDDWWEQDEDKSPETDYEEIAKEEMKDFKTKFDLDDYAIYHRIKETLGDLFYKGTLAEVRQAILKERIKQLKGEVQVQGNRTTKQKELSKPLTRGEYEAKVIEETIGLKKSELRRYANDHDLNLNLTSKATLAQIRDAVIQGRTKQLMNESDSPVGTQTDTQKNWSFYAKKVQDDIYGMPKPDLIGYGQALRLKVPVDAKIDIIRKTIINQRADQLIQKENMGSGLRTRRIIVGRGYSSSDEEKPVRQNTIPKKVINGKFIDLNKLKNNILTVRYLKTGGFVPTVKSQHISNDVKSVIEDIISNRFEKRLFDKLETSEKRLIKRFITALKIDIDISSKEEDEYRQQFDILLGQLRAGNTNPDIKNKLKQYVVESMNSGMLTRREAFQLLYELTINN